MATSRDLQLTFSNKSDGYLFFRIPYAKSNPSGSDIRALVNYLTTNFSHTYSDTQSDGFAEFISATLVTTSKNAPTTTKTTLTVPED